MARDDIMRKIQKALALAGNNPSLEEAQTAMLMAQKLMAEHNIHLSEVQEAKSVDEQREIKRQHIPVKEILWWKWELANIVADNFRCYVTRSANRGVNFYGFEEDTQMAEMVFVFAVTTIIYLSKKYIRDTVEVGQRLRAVPLKNSYITGFLEGISWSFREQRNSNQFALVLTKPDQLVKFVEEKKFGKTKESRKVSEHDEHAHWSGYQDGRSFDHSERMVTE